MTAPRPGPGRARYRVERRDRYMLARIAGATFAGVRAARFAETGTASRYGDDRVVAGIR
ncbi:hypothetical protein [Nocardia testacea]|uniref:hypothetical protein n=1 Tax=Nocardia testacea TaxID=248551 RepID=UPI003A885CAA